MEVVRERLEREYDLDLISTAPSVQYEVLKTDGETIICDNPSQLPEPNYIEEIREPIVRTNILTPNEYVGSVITLCNNNRGVQKNMEYFGNQVSIVFELPLGGVIIDFFDQIKSITKGFASVEHSLIGFVKSDLTKIDVLINNKKVEDALFAIPNLLSIKNSYKKIQFVSFLAEWCPNCDYEAIELVNYVNTYNSLVDFSIVMQFTADAKSDRFISKYRLDTSLIEAECDQKDESLSRKTAFYKFRKTLRDNRKWGVPLHVIRVVKRSGNEIFTIKGESRREEVQNFLDKNLQKG